VRGQVVMHAETGTGDERGSSYVEAVSGPASAGGSPFCLPPGRRAGPARTWPRARQNPLPSSALPLPRDSAAACLLFNVRTTGSVLLLLHRASLASPCRVRRARRPYTHAMPWHADGRRTNDEYTQQDVHQVTVLKARRTAARLNPA
jgi:hypothetical protein